jgi:hypothetical protein
MPTRFSLFVSVSCLLLSSLIGCTSSSDDDTRPPTSFVPYPPPEPNLTFGETNDDPSADGPLLFEKPISNPNPKTLAGIYERTGNASGLSEIHQAYVINDWRSRLEIRKDTIVAGTECTITISNETKTLYAYVSSALTVEPWGVRIEKAQKDKSAWAEYGVECGVDISDETWPYCLGSSFDVPETYSACVYLDRSLNLMVRKLSDGSAIMGKKIRN